MYYKAFKVLFIFVIHFEKDFMVVEVISLDEENPCSLVLHDRRENRAFRSSTQGSRSFLRKNATEN